MSINTKKIIVSSTVLIWARKTLFGGNLQEAAYKIGITQNELKLWETSNPTISVSQLKKLSKVYKRHISVLLLSTPSISQQPPKFRKLPDFDKAIFEQVAFLSIRQAQEIQSATIYLLQEKQNEFVTELKKYNKNPQLLASKVMELLAINEKLRFKSKTSREQLIIWKRLLESKGIIILELNLPLKDARAFALYDSVAPVIALSSKDTDNGRIFSLFHELGHIALEQTDIDEEFNLASRSQNNDEQYCNLFSASVLVPDDLLKNAIKGVSVMSEDYVKNVAKSFKVSTSVIWIKLYNNHLINNIDFNKVRYKLSTFEPFPIKKEFRANKNTYLYTKIKRKSEFFISEVFEAFNQNRITYFDVLNYVGVKADALPKLQRLMFV